MGGDVRMFHLLQEVLTIRKVDTWTASISRKRSYVDRIDHSSRVLSKRISLLSGQKEVMKSGNLFWKCDLIQKRNRQHKDQFVEPPDTGDVKRVP